MTPSATLLMSTAEGRPRYGHARTSCAASWIIVVAACTALKPVSTTMRQDPSRVVYPLVGPGIGSQVYPKVPVPRVRGR